MEICAELSALICNSTPVRARVKRVLSSRDLELEGVRVLQKDDYFFDENVRLSKEEQKKIFLRYKFSEQAHLYMLLFAEALQDLVENGIQLTHDGDPVHNIVAMSNYHMEVSDLIDYYDIILYTNYGGKFRSISSLPTFKTMNTMKEMGLEFCKAIGRADPRFESDMLKENCQSVSTRTTMPHWWVGIVVKNKDEQFSSPESSKNSVKAQPSETYRMVHIDICGAAYDGSGFAKTRDGEIVSLLTFVTPNFRYSEHTEAGQALRFLFNGEARFGSEQDGIKRSEYRNMRYLKVSHQEPLRGLELSTLKTYILFIRPFADADIMMTRDHWKSIVHHYIDSLMLCLPVGAVVRAHNLSIRKDLNGKRGVVAKGPGEETVRKGNRLGIRFRKEMNLSLIQGSHMRPDVCHKQYLSNAEMMEECQMTGPDRNSDENFRYVPEELMGEILKMVDGNTPLERAVIYFSDGGKFSFSMLSDWKNVSMFQAVLQKPVCELFSDDVLRKIRSSLEVVNHPRGPEVLKIVLLLERALLKTGKQDCETLDSTGVELTDSKAGNEYERLLEKVAGRLESDTILRELFEILCFFHVIENPVLQLRKMPDRTNIPI